MPHCLIIDNMHECILEKLRNTDVEVDYRPDIKRPEILSILKNYQFLIVRSKTLIDREIIDHGPNLQYIARAGAGLENMDVEYMTQKGIKTLNAPEGNRDAVGEHAIGMLLSLLNKLNSADRKIRNRVWDREGGRGVELKNKTVGIIGYGNTGKAFAQRLKGFCCKVLAYDKYRINYGDEFVKEVSLEEIFIQADVISLHVPITDETRNMVNENFLDKFSKSIYLINTARGEVVPMKSVVYGLEAGKLLAVALDVLECEDLSKLSLEQEVNFQILAKSEKVLFTPHVGGWTYESYEKISSVLADKIIDLVQ